MATDAAAQPEQPAVEWELVSSIPDKLNPKFHRTSKNKWYKLNLPATEAIERFEFYPEIDAKFQQVLKDNLADGATGDDFVSGYIHHDNFEESVFIQPMRVSKIPNFSFIGKLGEKIDMVMFSLLIDSVYHLEINTVTEKPL